MCWRTALALVLASVPAAPAFGATRYVTNTGKDNASCAQATPCATIQHAVNIASAGDTIQIGKGNFIESFGVTIGKNLTVRGVGSFSTSVRAGGWQVSSVFTVPVGVTATLAEMQVRNGRAERGGGIYNLGTLTVHRVRIWKNQAVYGGGVMNEIGAHLTMTESEIAYNGASSQNATLDPRGGGLFNQGTATLDQVRIVANHAPGSAGVLTNHNLTVSRSLIARSGGDGVVNLGIVHLINTTVTGSDGAGIVTGGAAETHLTHVTITANGTNAKSRGGLYVYEGAVVALDNTIVAGNTPVQCRFESNLFAMSASGSMSSDQTCVLFAGNFPGVNPKLGKLTNNGGFSQTHALLPGSPAIDAAVSVFCPSEDQRGSMRPADGDLDGTPLCDIGAFEYVPPTELN